MSLCMAVHNSCIAVANTSFIDLYKNKEHKVLKFSENLSKDTEAVSDIKFSHDGSYLAIITSVSKKLIIYNLTDRNESKSYDLPRAASKIRFTSDNKSILVADKTGDALIYDLKEGNGTKLLGHLSLLLDVLLTEDKKFVITSDRDEKIRITNYPNTYNIQSYCMGHKEFVNHIDILPNDPKTLISASGDGTLKLWSYINGSLLHTIDTSNEVNDKNLIKKFIESMDKDGVEVSTLPIVDMSIMYVDAETNFVAVTVYTYNCILVYSIHKIEEKYKHKLEFTLPFPSFPSNFKLCDTHLWVSLNNTESDLDKTEPNLNNTKPNLNNQDPNLIDSEPIVLVYKLTKDNGKLNLLLQEKIVMFEGNSNGIDIKSKQDSIKVLYKRKFDNVQEYQERKKQRLEKNK